MRRGVALVWLLGVLMVGGPAWARIGTIDDVPAATLLLPYFEVDLLDPLGANTILTVNNAEASAALVRVVLWTDLSVPALAFNVYLTGYDAQVIDLRRVLQGQLPQTASDGQDPTDTISPQGILSQDINFASCNGVLPHPPIPLAQLVGARNALMGKFSATLGGCAGLPTRGAIARGYVTVDSVVACSPFVPSDPEYHRLIDTRNILWGDYLHVNLRERTSRGDTLVHIEASRDDPETSQAGQYTFYGRYVEWSAADAREPLATSFAVRYANAPLWQAGSRSHLTVWRDSKVVQGPFACDALPAWYPLGQEQIVAFDEQEELAAVTTLPFPAETQRVRVGGAELPVSFTSGWLYLNLNTAVAPAGANPPEDDAAAQAWVSVEHRTTESAGRSVIHGAGYRAIQLDSATQASHEQLPVPLPAR